MLVYLHLIFLLQISTHIVKCHCTCKIRSPPPCVQPWCTSCLCAHRNSTGTVGTIKCTYTLWFTCTYYMYMYRYRYSDTLATSSQCIVEPVLMHIICTCTGHYNDWLSRNVKSKFTNSKILWKCNKKNIVKFVSSWHPHRSDTEYSNAVRLCFITKQQKNNVNNIFQPCPSSPRFNENCWNLRRAINRQQIEGRAFIVWTFIRSSPPIYYWEERWPPLAASVQNLTLRLGLTCGFTSFTTFDFEQDNE